MKQDDIDDIDVDKFLAGVEKLALEAGDWRQHLSYEAVRRYRTNLAVRDRYRKHAESCHYCQELVRLFGA